MNAFKSMFNNTKQEDFKKSWELGEKLGSGSFATVKACTHRETGQKCAVKIIDKSKLKEQESEEMFENEVAIMRKLEHPNIISLVSVYTDKTKHYVVMELLTGGELFDRIVERGFDSEKDAADVTFKMLSALSYLHKNGIVHRDLKPENLLYADDTASEIKLADFGLAKLWNHNTTMETACGTPGYVAPEVLKKNKSSGRFEGYDSAVDLWSTGVILYILLVGYPPFNEENPPQLFKQIMEGRYQFHKPWWDTISDDAKDLVRKLMCVDPKKRLTADEALQHPWLKTTRSEPIPDMVKSLKEYNAKRKLKKAVNVVMVMNQLAHLTTDHHAASGST